MMKQLLIIVFLIIVQSAYSQTTVKWEENFDDDDIISRGWKEVNRDSSGSATMHILPAFEFVTIGTQSPQTGSYFWRFNFEDANAKGLIDNWLISPKFENIVAGDSISFWCGAVDKNFKDSLLVWISTVDNVPWTFKTIDYFKVEGPVGSWHKKSYDLSKYAGQYIYVGVQYFHSDGGALGSSSDHVWLDHFTLTGPGTPPVIITSYELNQNFPNPFNPGTEINFSILENTNVSLKVYNTAGELVATLVNGFMTTGKYSVDFDGTSLASGVYFYKLSAGSFTDTKKMTLVK
jgi:hypothetical protein